MSTRNIILLERLRFRLVNEAKSHDQTVYAQITLENPLPPGTKGIAVSCATAACAAGTTCLLVGDSFYIQPHRGNLGIYYADLVVDSFGHTHDIFKRARKQLGLTKKEARIFFHPDHTNEQTIDLLDRLIAGKKIRWYGDEDRRWNES